LELLELCRTFVLVPASPASAQQTRDNMPTFDDSEEVARRPPFAMRKGHRCRLARENDTESSKGRARYSQSVGKNRGFVEPRLRFRKASQCIVGILEDEARDALEWEQADAKALTAWHAEEFYSTSFWREDAIRPEADVLSVSSFGSLDSWSIISQPGGDAESTTTAGSGCTAPAHPETAWEAAERRAAESAEAYAAKIQKRKVAGPKATKPSSKVPPKPGQFFSSVERFAMPPCGAGRPDPSLQDLHDEVLSYAGTQREVTNRLQWLKRDSQEFRAVESYFVKTLGGIGAKVESIHAIQNPKVQRRYRSGGETVMFHGCRSQQNEDKILDNGFTVSACRSGGAGFGTWFAYNASYSNCGYAFTDSVGMKHMFICIVSYYYTVLDNSTMRVVGQDCAYPQWLVKYEDPNWRRPRAIPPTGATTSVRAQPEVWHVVKDGEWVPVRGRPDR